MEEKREQKAQNVTLIDDETSLMIGSLYEKAKHRLLLLDYDGTLTNFQKLPEEAIPSKEIKGLLKKLSSSKKNNVVIISGRDSVTLEKWFNKLPLTLIAEHGALIRRKNKNWDQMVYVFPDWKENIKPIMDFYSQNCPGSFTEEKAYTLAWHYRNAENGFPVSRELIRALSKIIYNNNLQVVDGNKVLEVRMNGIDKGVVAKKIVSELNPDFILCMGDDRTDEDMFRALKGKAITIKISNEPTAAQYKMLSQENVLPLLNRLLEFS